MMFIGIGVKASGYRVADILYYGAGVLALIHWIWAIIDVIGRSDLKPFQKRFWLIAVVAVPVFGALIFYIMHQERNRITT